MTVCDFKEILAEKLTCPVYHEKALKDSGDYVVWLELRQQSLCADNSRVQINNVVEVNFYTDVEYSDYIQQIVDVFDFIDAAYDDYVVDADEEAGQYRYIWTVVI